MSNNNFFINQVVGSELLVARIDSVGNFEEACYLHNIATGAKATLRPGQSFSTIDGEYKLLDVMNDYIIVSQGDEDEEVRSDDEFIINESIYDKGDLVVTRLDREKGICYCHSISTRAKLSIYTGQQVQIGDIIVQLVGVTSNTAQFSQ